MSAVYLQQFPSYLKHNCKIIVIFTYPGLHFLFALGTPLWQSRKTLHERKDNSMLAKPLAACIVSIYLQQFPSYSNRKCKKIAVFTYRSPHFCFPWRRHCDYHAICCMDGKTIQCLPKPSLPRSMYLSIFNSFRDMRCLSQCASPKIAIFTTFLFPLGTPLGQSR